MATFKVGQRVRMLSTPREPWEDEGTIVAYDENGPRGEAGSQNVWVVRADHHPSGRGSVKGYPDCWWCAAWCLRPLTDPKADEFIESLKKLGGKPQIRDNEVGVAETRARFKQRIREINS